MNIVRVLVFGDTVGSPGRKACRALLPKLKEEHEADLVVVNGENIAHGSSLTKDTTEELLSAGVDVVTSGDHVFRKKEGSVVVEAYEHVLRPLNYPEGAPGNGVYIARTESGIPVAVVNIMGRVFMPALDCPFAAVSKAVERITAETKTILVDFHAEATSEKVAMGWFLDGRVSAVFGTHTHVQTADETILPKGTAYITDLGMCGPHRSVIGRKIEHVLKRLTTAMPTHLEVATDDPRVSGALIEIDADTGHARSIRRIHERVNAPVHY